MKDSVSQIALSAAFDNETKAREVAERQAATVRAAKAAKDALIDSAASGKPVKAEDVRSAEETTRTAEADAAIAQSIHAGATRKRHEAQNVQWHDDAAALSEAAESALVERIAAGRAVDDAKAALEAAIVKFHETGTVFENARRAVAFFNGDAPARLAMNPVLAAAPQGSAPHAKAPHNAKIRQLQVVIVEQSGWIDAPKSLENIAAGEALLAGRRDLLSAA
jgi:hypothetical protein